MNLSAWWKNLWTRKPSQTDAAPVAKGEAVPFPRSYGGAMGEGAVRIRNGRGLLWFGSNVEGYDALLGRAGDSRCVDFGAYTPSDNSIVAICLNWITTSWSTTPLLVGKMNGGQFEPLEGGHPLQDLMAAPHPDCIGDWLISLWLQDFFDAGNAYGNIVTAGKFGPPKQIQALPASRMEPMDPPDAERAEKLVGWYEYRPGSTPQRLDVPSVIHFKYGADPNDLKRGRKPLFPARREIATDNLASEVAAAIMRRPHPSGVLSPDADVEDVEEDDLVTTKRMVEEVTSGEHAGGIVAFPTKVKFQQLSFNPKDLAMDEARKKPEERVAALFGIPPVVVGLGAGLDRSTYNNMAEARKAAWHDCMIPLQDYFAAVITAKLLPMYGGDPDLVCMWDRSQVGVLQPDKTEERKVALEEYKAGVITLNEYRAKIGMEPIDGGDELKKPAAVPIALNGDEDDEGDNRNGNGNGKGGAKNYRLPPFPLSRT